MSLPTGGMDGSRTAVVSDVSQSGDPLALAVSSWRTVLESLDEAVLVMDGNRQLAFVNEPARRLLGYDKGDCLEGRCKLTTRGRDCDSGCPLTYALKAGITKVDDFVTVYLSRDGDPVSVRVTVVPLIDGSNEPVGAVEILRPTQPDLGFFLAGSSDEARRLRARVVQVARRDLPVVLVGEAPARADVARTIHRLGGLSEELYCEWRGGSNNVPDWPPGTMYVADGDYEGAPVREGWRLIVGFDSGDGPPGLLDDADVVELPGVAIRGSDLPNMIAAWVDQMSMGTQVSPEALQQLCRMAADVGFEPLQEVISTAVAAAGSRLETRHLPADGYCSALVDEVLSCGDPLSAIEERLLRELLGRCAWRMQEAADRLGVSRVTLWRKLREHGIVRPDGCEPED